MVMKRPDEAATFWVHQNDVRALLRFDGVAFSEQSTKDLGGLGAWPVAHCQAASMETVTESAESFCSSMRSARTRNARACAEAMASLSVVP